MSSEKEVVCNKAGSLDFCDGCVHSTAHGRYDDKRGDDTSCTTWGKCSDMSIKCTEQGVK